MSGHVNYVAVLLSAYVLLVLVVGVVATRRARRSPEEYFLAGRGLGTVVLFMALFGTNATAFVLVGIPGRAYQDGVAVFGVNAAIIALGIPLSFYAVGAPARRMAVRLQALTPVELYRRRFGSRGLGLLLFACFTAYTLPYMVSAVKGAAVTLEQVTDGAVSQRVVGLCVLVVALIYTSLGGMRATAWTNVVQGFLFLGFMVAAFFGVAHGLGGLEAATQRVLDHDPELLTVRFEGRYSPPAWISWGLAISLTVVAFPHMLARLMAAGGDRPLRSVCRLYPLALLALWMPAVLIGVWGAAAFPGLTGQDTDRIFPLMVAEYLPAWLAGFGAVAVLAAVMSTLDAQILTLSSILVRDVLDPFLRPESRADVLASRVFSLLVVGVVYVLSECWGDSVFEIARLAFSGYVLLVPVLFLGVRWRRFTTAGAVASIVVGNLVLYLGTQGWLPLLGFLPVFWGFVLAAVAAVVTSLITRPAPAEQLRLAFGESAS